jgi:hypothetical protein
MHARSRQRNLKEKGRIQQVTRAGICPVVERSLKIVKFIVKRTSLNKNDWRKNSRGVATPKLKHIQNTGKCMEKLAGKVGGKNSSQRIE